LIVLGAKGLTDPLSFHLGSVALKVMKYAKAGVLLVRPKTVTLTQESGKKDKTDTPKRVLIATDGSKCADDVIQFLLDLPLPHQTKVHVITVLQSDLEIWMKAPTLDFHMNQEILAKLHELEKIEAQKITDIVERRFQENCYNTTSLILRGAAGESILAAAKKYEPEIIAIGSRGLTGVKSFLLGSVAERVARYANCSVLIGRASR